MKVYKIEFDYDYQAIQTPERHTLPPEVTDVEHIGASIAKHWRNLPFNPLDLKERRGSFYAWKSGNLVLAEETTQDQTLVKLLETAGEFLPLTIDGRPALYHNIVGLTDCIDKDGSEWDGKVPFKPRFIPDSLPLGVPFKLREYRGPQYVVTDSSLPPEKDFFQWYHKQGLTGLTFRLQWDSEKPDALIPLY